MKKSIIALSLLVSALGASAQTAGTGLKPIGYPGSNWSVLQFNPSPVKGTPEDDNILLQGRIEQGIDWMRFGAAKEWRFNTYAALGYSADKNGLAYNNKIVPTLGAKISRDFDSGVLDLGVAVIHQHSFKGVTTGPTSGTGASVYVSYWFGWDLSKKK